MIFFMILVFFKINNRIIVVLVTPKCTFSMINLFFLYFNSALYFLYLSEKYKVDPYTRQVIELTQRRIEGVFGKDKELQTGLNSWFTEESVVEE